MPPRNTNNDMFPLRGVRLRAKGRFGAEIWKRDIKRSVWLGTFNSPIQAALAYDRASVQFYGEAAWTNFPVQGHRPLRPVHLHPRQHHLPQQQQLQHHPRQDHLQQQQLQPYHQPRQQAPRVYGLMPPNHNNPIIIPDDDDDDDDEDTMSESSSSISEVVDLPPETCKDKVNFDLNNPPPPGFII